MSAGPVRIILAVGSGILSGHHLAIHVRGADRVCVATWNRRTKVVTEYTTAEQLPTAARANMLRALASGVIGPRTWKAS